MRFSYWRSALCSSVLPPGIVDQPVVRSPFLDAPRHRGLRERWIRDAARRGDDPVWMFCRERLETFGVQVDRDNIAAEFDHERADRAANSLRGAGDDDVAAF